MKHLLILLLSLGFISCNTKPEPLVAGKDSCSYCKMPMAETKFGGELITEKGKIYKFDDIACMVYFMRSKINSDEKFKQVLAANNSNPTELLDVQKSVFLISPGFHTPMNSGVACFSSNADANALKDSSARLATWNELLETIR